MKVNGRMYYGWVVVAAAFTLMFTGFGAAYSFAAFFKAIDIGAATIAYRTTPGYDTGRMAPRSRARPDSDRPSRR